jgi:hypothetical protein
MRLNGAETMEPPVHRLREDLEAGLKGGALLPKRFIAENSRPITAPSDYIQRMLGPGISAIVGPSSVGKTTLTATIGRACATGEPVFGRKVLRPMGVAHIMGESLASIELAYAALRIRAGDTRKLPIVWADNEGRDLTQKQAREALKTDLRLVSKHMLAEDGVPLKVVFFDTVTRTFPMQDENSNAEMNRIMGYLGEIAQAIDGTAVAIHHPPKTGIGERGGGALRGGADYIITASCDRDDTTGIVSNRQLAVTKHRTGTTGPISAFDLEQVGLGILDAFGEEATSVVAVPADQQKTADRVDRLSKNERTMLAILHEAGPTGFSLEEWYERARRAGIGTNRRATLTDCQIGLRRRGLIFEGATGWFAKLC